jgi:hypothetical protein
MCPACIATATLVLTGATSAGGVTALVLKVLHGRNRLLLTTTKLLIIRRTCND